MAGRKEKALHGKDDSDEEGLAYAISQMSLEGSEDRGVDHCCPLATRFADGEDGFIHWIPFSCKCRRSIIPEAPGVYEFKSKNKPFVEYIGHSINLKKRITGYISGKQYLDANFNANIEYRYKTTPSVEAAKTEKVNRKKHFKEIHGAFPRFNKKN